MAPWPFSRWTRDRALKFDLPVGRGPSRKIQAQIDGPALTWLSTKPTILPWRRAASFHIVGTDPSLGGNTTTIPDRAGAFEIHFPGNVTLDGTNVIAATKILRCS